MSQATIQITASTDETFFAMQQPFRSCCRYRGGRVLMYASWLGKMIFHSGSPQLVLDGAAKVYSFGFALHEYIFQDL